MKTSNRITIATAIIVSLLFTIGQGYAISGEARRFQGR